MIWKSWKFNFSDDILTISYFLYDKRNGDSIVFERPLGSVEYVVHKDSRPTYKSRCSVPFEQYREFYELRDAIKFVEETTKEAKTI